MPQQTCSDGAEQAVPTFHNQLRPTTRADQSMVSSTPQSEADWVCCVLSQLPCLFSLANRGSLSPALLPASAQLEQSGALIQSTVAVVNGCERCLTTDYNETQLPGARERKNR